MAPCDIPALEFGKGSCPKCRGRRTVTDKKTGKRIPCRACKSTGILLDVIY